jgi:Zn finger protein HypA/HybF involved in hydrogenase expression
MTRPYRQYTNEDVLESIKNNISWRGVAISLGLNGNTGSYYNTLKTIADQCNFDYSHFKGSGWNLGNDAINAIPFEDLLKKGVRCKSVYLKNKLLKKGLLKNVCSKCGQLPLWNNEPLVLELDHIDGDHTNNELSNLRILCPHCHSQTPAFRGRGRNINKRFCKACNKQITVQSKSGLCTRCVKNKIAPVDQ